MDMMERHRMIEAQPHLATASGTSLSVVVAEPKAERVRVNLGFRQSGSGTPSASNVRTLSGWYLPGIKIDGTDITTVPESLGGMIHGYYDSKSGVKYYDYILQTLTDGTGISSYSTSGSSSIFWGYCGQLAIYNSDNTVLSNMFTFYGYNYDYAGASDWQIGGSSSYPNSFWAKIPTSVLSEGSLDGVKEWIASHNIQVVAPRKSGPVATEIGTMSISLPRGQHTISAFSGSTIELDYWTH